MMVQIAMMKRIPALMKKNWTSGGWVSVKGSRGFILC